MYRIIVIEYIDVLVGLGSLVPTVSFTTPPSPHSPASPHSHPSLPKKLLFLGPFLPTSMFLSHSLPSLAPLSITRFFPPHFLSFSPFFLSVSHALLSSFPSSFLPGCSFRLVSPYMPISQTLPCYTCLASILSISYIFLLPISW